MSDDDTVFETPVEKKVFTRGRLGKGSAGKRLKSGWQALGRRGSLKAYARGLPSQVDTEQWLFNKKNA